MTFKVDEVLSKHNYDESKYIQSLDLKPLQQKMFQNLHKCLNTLGKIEEVQKKSNALQEQQQDYDNNENNDNDSEKDSIKNIQEKINKIPYKNGHFENDDLFDVELINDVNWCQDYLNQFNVRLGQIIDHLFIISAHPPIFSQKKAFTKSRLNL